MFFYLQAMKLWWILTLAALCLAILIAQAEAHDEHHRILSGKMRVLLHEGHAHSPLGAPSPGRRLLHEGHVHSPLGAPTPGRRLLHEGHVHSPFGAPSPGRRLLHEGHDHSPAGAPTLGRRLLHEGHDDASEGVLIAPAPAPSIAVVPK